MRRRATNKLCQCSVLVSGNLNESDLEIEIDGIIIRLFIYSGTSARLTLRPVSDTVVIDIRRMTRYDTSTVEGFYRNRYTLSTEFSVDDLVYTSTNDNTTTWIRIGNVTYEYKYFISDNGNLADLSLRRF